MEKKMNFSYFPNVSNVSIGPKNKFRFDMGWRGKHSAVLYNNNNNQGGILFNGNLCNIENKWQDILIIYGWWCY